ncbi:MAG: hypothetical protein RBS43_08560 [Candidatus Cloacimonas sp.]|nr:hypothetical protein [Candidatus Cloacimonas sp.]
MFRRLLVCLLWMFVGYSYLQGITVDNVTRCTINDLRFNLSLQGEKRVTDFANEPLTFSCSSTANEACITICYTGDDLDLELTLTPKPGLGAKAWLASATASFKTDILLRKLLFKLDFDNPHLVKTLQGVAAINSSNDAENINLCPYTNKAVEFQSGENAFWLVASNYEGCMGVESLGSSTINLYDQALHYFRQYRPGHTQSYYPRDAMHKTVGQTHNWSWLFFEERPFLLDINLWPADKQAALAITNDADRESYDALAAIFWGSNNPQNPKYSNQGLFANNIKISNSVFGCNIPILGGIMDEIVEHGSTIGYHTYQYEADPPGANQIPLLQQLAPYNVRLWIDHINTSNPENLAYNGLEQGSPAYIGDVLLQSHIDYAWISDDASTNAFNAFDDPWRLPHRLYEMEAFGKQLIYFGRTREYTWEYIDGNSIIDMKHSLTSENLDKLIQDKGLHISQAKLSLLNGNGRRAFHLIAENGDYEIRPEVESFLNMLDAYQQNRGLWIDTVEAILDRMLATELVSVESVLPCGAPGCFWLTLINNSEEDIKDFSVMHKNKQIRIPNFTAHSREVLLVNSENTLNASQTGSPYRMQYATNKLYVYRKDGSALAPAKIIIYNLRGQLVHSYESSSPTKLLEIPFAAFASGIYFSKIESSSGESDLLKLTLVK